jgi:hypothetical protein
MEDIDYIAAHYKTLHTQELVEIAADPGGLRPEIIPVLQKELIARNKPEEALQLSDFLVHGSTSLKNLSTQALQQLINQRLEAGETLESIKIDLRDNNIDIFDIINYESRHKDKTFDYMLALKEKGLDDIAISEKLQETFSIKEAESEILRQQLKSRGRRNTIIGWSIVVAICIIMLVAVGNGGSIGMGSILLFGIGIWRIVEGQRQSK